MMWEGLQNNNIVDRITVYSILNHLQEVCKFGVLFDLQFLLDQFVESFASFNWYASCGLTWNRWHDYSGPCPYNKLKCRKCSTWGNFFFNWCGQPSGMTSCGDVYVFNIVLFWRTLGALMCFRFICQIPTFLYTFFKPFWPYEPLRILWLQQDIKLINIQ